MSHIVEIQTEVRDPVAVRSACERRLSWRGDDGRPGCARRPCPHRVSVTFPSVEASRAARFRGDRSLAAPFLEGRRWATWRCDPALPNHPRLRPGLCRSTLPGPARRVVPGPSLPALQEKGTPERAQVACSPSSAPREEHGVEHVFGPGQARRGSTGCAAYVA